MEPRHVVDMLEDAAGAAALPLDKVRRDHALAWACSIVRKAVRSAASMLQAQIE